MKTNVYCSTTRFARGRGPAAQARRGMTIFETIVAFTLLSTVLSVVLPMTIRHGRLLVEQRNYRVALDELTNQFERLTALPVDELPAALESLQLSELATKKLPSATLEAQLVPEDVGQLLTLRLAWHVARPDLPPLTLSTWIPPASAPADTENAP